MSGTHLNGKIDLILQAARFNILEYQWEISLSLFPISENEIQGEWKSTSGSYGKLSASRQANVPDNANDYKKKLAQANSAFIIMSFSDKTDGYLPTIDIHSALKRACCTLGIESIRADEIEHSGVVTKLIQEEIRLHRFLICDLTYQRQNVYYEVGYAHGLGKEVIITAQKGTKVHFDIAGYNLINYSNLTDLENRVLSRIKSKLTTEEHDNL